MLDCKPPWLGSHVACALLLLLADDIKDMTVSVPHKKRYGDGAGNTVEENSSIFCLIQMR